VWSSFSAFDITDTASHNSASSLLANDAVQKFPECQQDQGPSFSREFRKRVESLFNNEQPISVGTRAKAHSVFSNSRDKTLLNAQNLVLTKNIRVYLSVKRNTS
jgi:hypothetical protein